jgi:hypothetical protein
VRFTHCGRKGKREFANSWSRFDQSFPFQDSPNLLECGTDPPIRETDLTQPFDVRELGTPVFEENDRSGEAESALEEANFMDDVLTRGHTAVRPLVFGGENEQGDGRLIEHLGQALNVRQARYWHAVELVPRESQPVMHEVLQLSPQQRPAVTDDDACTGCPSGALAP